MANQFLDDVGLTTFFTQLKNIFAAKKAVAQVKSDTDPYIFDIDYDAVLKFNTGFIVTGEATSPIIDVGQVGYLIIAES